MRMSLEERFWKRVNKTDGCWIWAGSTQGRYGQIKIAPSRNTSTHRYSWELHNGPIPKGMVVCHSCDNTRCVRPDHLFIGVIGKRH